MALIPFQIRFSAPILFLIAIPAICNRIFHFNLLEFIGCAFSVASSSYFIHRVVLFIYRNWVGVWLSHNIDLKSIGSWAVVTGCTAGIGNSYAHALAKRGINLVLIARSKEKLFQLETKIGELYPSIKVKTIIVDFTGGMEIYKEIEKELEGLEIGTLINNVGVCYPYPEYFIDLPNRQKFYGDMLNCNILSVTMMTSIILPGMLDRRKGVVVNISSITSKMDAPFLALYSASKAFVDKFTQDLTLEYKDRGVIFQDLIPGYVVSNMSKVKASNFFVPTAEAFVEKALNAVGLESRTTGWVSHQLLYACVHIGHFFRREMAGEISIMVMKQFWLYGKKVQYYRSRLEQN